MSPKNVKRILLAAVLVGVGLGVAYAAFSSNVISLGNQTLTTGEASLKLCDTGDRNQWLTAANPPLNVNRMIPDEERDLLGERAIYIGNDNGQLPAQFEPGRCQQYAEIASNSNTPLRLIPTVVINSEACPAPLPSQVKLRFAFGDSQTDYRTLTSWSTSTTAYDPVVEPGQTTQLGISAQLSSATTVQNERCQFTVNFIGKQPI